MRDMPHSLCQQSPDTSGAEGARLVPTGIGCLWSMLEVCPYHEEVVGMEKAKEARMLEAVRGIQASR